MSKYENRIKELQGQSITMAEAETLALEFLSGMTDTSNALRELDLDARLKKSGLKAIRAAVYLEVLQKNEKKPTEAQLTALLDSDELIRSAQDSLDQAEVDREHEKRMFDICINAHQYYRAVMKGSFNG